MSRIDLSNVNISLKQFNDISSGVHNAGEVKLASDHSLTKVNNHVHKTSRNVVAIPHAEVIAIKEAFVRALSRGGVLADEINRVRQELGLAADGAVDRSLNSRSIRPLTRQQIRDILDRNAATLNTFAQEHGDRTRVRTSAEIYGAGGMRADRAGRRDAANAQLAAPNRALCINTDIANFQRVVSGGGEIADHKTRQGMVTVARELIDAVLVASHGSPREDVDAKAELRLANGQTISMPPGMSEAAFVRRLEDQIVRLTNGGVSKNEVELHNQVRKLATPEAREAFFAGLVDDPRGGYKARVAAIAILYAHGVTDAAALEVPNRLSDADAIVLAHHLSSLPENATADELASNPLLLAMAAKHPAQVASADRAYVPAISDAAFNKRIEEMFMNNELMPSYQLLAVQTAEIVRGRLGAIALPDNTAPGRVVNSNESGTAVKEAAQEGGGRVTLANLREPLLAAALRTGAERLVMNLVKNRLAELGKGDASAFGIAKSFTVRNPGVIERLVAAQSPAEAEAICAEFREAIADAVRVDGELEEIRAGVEDKVRRTFAERLGIPPETMDKAPLEMRDIRRKASDLATKIENGDLPLTTRAQFQEAFDKLVDSFVAERISRLAEVDSLELPQAAKNDIKILLLSIQKVKDIDIAFLAAEAARIDAGALEAALQTFANRDAVFGAMKPVTEAIGSAVERMLAGKEEVGPDDRDAPITILARMIIAKNPGAERLLRAFYAKPDVMEAIRNRGADTNSPAYASAPFEQFSDNPQISLANPAQTAALQRILDMPREFAALQRILDISREFAAFRAVGGLDRAAAAGYHASELPMLARAFAFHKAATGSTDEVALEAALDHQSATRRLASYGGRFTASVDNFRAGLALMDKFAAWYANLAEDFKAGKFDTVTKSNAGSTFADAKAVRAYEMFVFQDLAINKADLSEADPEKLFGVANNDAMNFFVRGNGSGCTGTLVALPPAKRQVVYAVFRTLEPHSAELGQRHWASVFDNENVLARVLRHFDEIADLVKAGQLDRTRINAILTPDLDLPPDATPRQVRDAMQERYYPLFRQSPEKLMEISTMFTTTGCTVTEAMAAMEGGERPEPLPEVASTTMKIEQIDGTTKGGRSFMLGDLIRPQNPTYINGGRNVLTPEQNYFTVNIGGETIRCAKDGKASQNAHIADKIEALCGKVHVEQANTVMRGLSQGGHGPLIAILPQHGIVGGIGSEHTPMTYTLSKNDVTGAVTIRYSEPEGFPFKFHWETTVALDGTATTTPVVAEPLQQA